MWFRHADRPDILQAVLEAEVVHKLLKMKLESYTVGTNLLRFVRT